MFEAKTFSIGVLKGISSKTIEEHLKLYQGYVKHANLILDHIKELSSDAEKNGYEINELQRRFGFEWGGMRNHEVYFSLLEDGAKELSVGSKLQEAIIAQWASVEAWVERFKTIAMIRGVGWAILYFDPVSKKLLNAWVDEQQLGQLAGCIPIVALDMWEHSYVADYQPSGKKQYIEDFLANINWTKAEALFDQAQ